MTDDKQMPGDQVAGKQVSASLSSIFNVGSRAVTHRGGRAGSLRYRILLSMVLIAMGTLAITWLGTYVLVGHVATSSEASSILTDAREVATIAPHVRVSDTKKLLLAAGFSGGGVVTISPNGQIAPPLTTLPPGVSASQLDMQKLLNGYAIAGASGHLAYAAVPLYLSTRINTVLHVATNELVVMVVTRRIKPPSTGLEYFILIGLASLLVAGLVAWILSRRLASSISNVVSTANRLASGELEARVETSQRDYREIASLADAINDMATQLDNSQQSERQFLLSVSHDLRTPLTSIRGYAEAILDGAVDDTTHAVEIIRDESYRLDGLIRDLLDLAHLQAKRFSLDMEPVDISAVVQQVASIFLPVANQRDIVIEVVGIGSTGSIGSTNTVAGKLVAPKLEDERYAEAVLDAHPKSIVVNDKGVPVAAGHPNNIVVNGDEGRLVQSIGNIVDNALKYARSRIQLHYGIDNGQAVISVLDDGPGIAVDDLAHVFERHYRADTSRSTGGGTGLGLAIVSELVEAMHGTVSIYSHESGIDGTEVVIRLPLSEPPASVASRK